MEQEHLQKATLQRAALMGLILGMLREEEECSLVDIKLKIAGAIGLMITTGVMVGDFIDTEVADECKSVLQAESLVRDIREFLN